MTTYCLLNIGGGINDAITWNSATQTWNSPTATWNSTNAGTVSGVTDTTNIMLTKSQADNNATSRLEWDIPNWVGLHKSDFPIGQDVFLYADLNVNPAVTKIFGGTISEVYFKGLGSNKETLHITARDYTAVLQANIVDPEIYTNQEISVIVANLMSKYAPPSFTVVNVNVTGFVQPRITFKSISLFDALKQLADLVDYYFYVDENKDLHFQPKNTVASGLTFDNTNSPTVEFKTDLDTVKNRVYVYGGRQTTKQPTETFTADGVGSVFTLKYSPQNTQVAVSGVQKKGDIYNAAIAPASGPDYLVNFHDAKIIFLSGTTLGYNSRPGSLVQVTVDYDVERPIVKLAEDMHSIGLYGKRALEISDQKILDPQVAIGISTSQLALLKDPALQGTISVKGVVAVTPGQTCVVNFPYQGQVNSIVNILSATYNFNVSNNFSDRVLTVKVGTRIPNVTDVLKNLILAQKRLEAGQVNSSQIITRIISGNGSYGLQVPNWTLAQRLINDSYVVGHPINGVIGVVSDAGLTGSWIGLAASGSWISGTMGVGWDKAAGFGSGARVFVPDTNALVNVGSKDNYTVACWFKKSGLAQDCSVSEHWEGGGYPWAIRSFNNYRFLIYDGTTGGGTGAPAGSYGDDVWHHLVGVRSWTLGSTYFYIDGVLQGSNKDPTNGNCRSSSNGFIIGGRQSANGGQSYVGSIDDFRVYTRALSAAEIGSLYLKQNITGSLVAYYKFDEGIGSLAYSSTSGTDYKLQPIIGDRRGIAQVLRSGAT